MGLDMYLERRLEILGWYGKSTRRVSLEAVGEAGETLERLDMEKQRLAVEEEVAYWRKANAIHHWFVQHCQDGVDDCRPAYVASDQLETLLELCKLVKENPDRAADLLPTEGGFFFGSTEYDDWYFEDINNTITMLTEILETEKGITNANISYYYQSSW